MFGATAALESLPMIANAEATLTSVESPASQAGISTASRYIDPIVVACPARACHMVCAAFVYTVCVLQHASQELQSATCDLQ
jgi:hypothetical protein